MNAWLTNADVLPIIGSLRLAERLTKRHPNFDLLFLEEA